MRATMIAVKVALVLGGAAIALATISLLTVSFLGYVLGGGIGLAIVAMGVALPVPRKHVVEYYRRWNAESGAGEEPVDPLVDKLDGYVKLIPVPKERVRHVIQVGYDGGARVETKIGEVPLARGSVASKAAMSEDLRLEKTGVPSNSQSGR
jgi:hypothetical protein